MSLTSASIENFITVLRQSGLIDESVLEKRRTAFLDSGQPDSPDTFAHFLVQQGDITNWHAAKLLKGKHKGFFLGKYKLLRLLGKGGMSSVYLAEHINMRRRCAVKVLPYKLVSDSSYLPRFYREAQAVAALDHPNIVRAYDIDHQTDGDMEIHFLVMEYVPGHNFYELVKGQGPIPPRQAADYIRQAALGLAHAHEAGMVHRDVKPGNFIVDDNGTVKVMDLGLAMVSKGKDESSVTLANEEKVLGTADYLAPEQAVDSHQIDSRADIYALGCTFFFLLTGHPPFDEGTLAQRLLAHQSKTPPEISEFRDDVPASLVTIIKKMLEKAPDDRFQTAEQVVVELTAWLNSSPADETPFTPPVIHDKSHDHLSGGAISDFLSHLQETPPLASSSTSRGKSLLKPDDERSQRKSRAAASDSGTTVFNSGLSSIITPASNSRSSRKKLRKRLRTQPINAAIILIALTAGIAAIYGLTRPSPSSPPASPTSTTEQIPEPVRTPIYEGPVLHVGPQGDFKTLSRALEYLTLATNSETGTKVNEIRIAAGQTLVDSVKLQGSGFLSLPKNLQITGEGPDFPTLKSEAGPVISLDAIEELSFNNLKLKCNGDSPAVELSGYLTGMRFNNVTIESISKTGILARGASGLAGQPLTFQSCRFEAAKETATAIRCEGTALGNTWQFDVQNCRFMGPMQKGITFVSPQGSTWDVNIAQCIFSQCQTAISFAGEDHDVSRVVIANNTFYEFGTGIRFESGPPASSSGVTFVQNLFVNGQGPELVTERADIDLTVLSKGTQPPQSNWTTSSPQVSKYSPDIFENQGRTDADNLQFVSTDPASPKFLAPSESQLRDAVSTPFLGRHYIGAVPP